MQDNIKSLEKQLKEAQKNLAAVKKAAQADKKKLNQELKQNLADAKSNAYNTGMLEALKKAEASAKEEQAFLDKAKKEFEKKQAVKAKKASTKKAATKKAVAKKKAAPKKQTSPIVNAEVESKQEEILSQIIEEVSMPAISSREQLDELLSEDSSDLVMEKEAEDSIV
jgi:histone H1/5